MTKNKMVYYLENFIVTFFFQKKDGTVREMTGTLRSDLLPKRADDNKLSTNYNPTLVHVYDLENEGWRSFHVDSLVGDITLKVP